ncbi:hypothetical protein [Micromonospora sp. NPDC048830]|uniref:hypothetical protein n=1 Tax=Micromonospora sp. NPDC048830 TaxID=3364257 RepID=UPI003724024C
MRHRHLDTATLALGVVVLTDVLRVFLPSVITVFGQAAATPAALLGAYALGWFLAAPALVRRIGARPVAAVAAVALAAARLALTAAPGGRTQLWLAAARASRWSPPTCNRRPGGSRWRRPGRWPTSPSGTRTAARWWSPAT